MHVLGGKGNVALAVTLPDEACRMSCLCTKRRKDGNFSFWEFGSATFFVTKQNLFEHRDILRRAPKFLIGSSLLASCSFDFVTSSNAWLFESAESYSSS